MENNRNIDIMITKKYSLSEKFLNQIMDKIMEDTGISTICYETENGYVFKDDRYSIPVGELTFNVIGGNYKKVQLYSAGIDEVRIRQTEERNRKIEAGKRARQKRRFALQVRKTIAATAVIAAVSIGGLMAAGVIDSPFKPHTPSIDTVTVAETPRLNNINNASDVVLVEWANSAMSEVREICDGSEYDYFKTLSQEVYTDYFVPVMSSYYNYLDYKDADLPIFPEYGDRDIVGEAHQTFRNNVITFANYLRDSMYFSKITFASSPLSNAVVTDKNGNVLSASGDRTGEVLGPDGSTLTSSESYDVKVQLNDLEGTPYSLDNLPADATIINGEVYVNSSHMYQDYGTMSK